MAGLSAVVDGHGSQPPVSADGATLCVCRGDRSPSCPSRTSPRNRSWRRPRSSPTVWAASPQRATVASSMSSTSPAVEHRAPSTFRSWPSTPSWAISRPHWPAPIARTDSQSTRIDTSPRSSTCSIDVSTFGWSSGAWTEPPAKLPHARFAPLAWLSILADQET